MASHLPPADPWDKQTGIHLVDEFQVSCVWTPINDDWAEVHVTIDLHDGTYDLIKPAQMKRVQQGKTVLPELICLAWTKRAVSSGGVTVLGLYEQNPGHKEHSDGSILFRWWAQVGTRMSLAIVQLGGDLAGTARLVPVE